MHHLQHAVVKFGDTGDITHLADRQERIQIVPARVEISQRDVAGVIMSVDAVGRARTVRRRGAVFVDGDGNGDHLAWLHVAQLRPRAAIDGAGRQVEQQVDDARPLAVEQSGVELFQPRPDAGQAGERSKQRIEQERPHGRHAGLRVEPTQCRPVQSGR
jgi:hypothetical protein